MPKIKAASRIGALMRSVLTLWFFLGLFGGVLGELGSPSSRAEVAAPIIRVTPFFRQALAPGCQSVVLDQANVMGFFSFATNEALSQVRILFKEGDLQSQVALSVTREDADILRKEITDLMKKVRVAPVRVERSISNEGACVAWAIED